MPPRSTKSVATPKDQPQAYREMGPPPKDTLKANEWAFGMMALVMWKCSTETGLTEKERRHEMRETAHTMRGLIPQVRLAQAEGVVKGSNDDLDRGGTGPEMEDAPKFNSNGSEPKARRGRPSKRSTIR